MKRKELERKLQRKYGKRVFVAYKNHSIVVQGELDTWEDIVEACSMCVSKNPSIHVVNDIALKGADSIPMRLPKVTDTVLEGKRPDVLIIGGGISGASIARELSKWDLSILLVDKEADLAIHASGRNDGEVHPGVDLPLGSLKQHYVWKANQMYDNVCKELNVPFKRVGQIVGFEDGKLLPIIKAYALEKKVRCGILDTQIISKEQLQQMEPHLSKDFAFGLYNPSAGSVCPYGLTIAYAENAVENGAQVFLNTAVLSMEVEDGLIYSVTTNRGTIYPKIVINAAGTFAEDVATMAKDRFYSIHPRKGTNSILDRETGALVKCITSWKTLKKSAGHTKGGGIVHTAFDNLLVGPDAIETREKENFATEQSSLDQVFAKQKIGLEELSQSDIITYFTGVRAATFEEDFVIEKGRHTRNLIHCAGIQSPGLTTAPAVALDVEKMALQLLRRVGPVRKNDTFNPYRKGIPRLREMKPFERNALIQENPDYGKIICRCEEISKGEILDALRSPIVVPTIDGVKKRVRPGMGRCQGGFCMPLVAKIISEECQIPLEEIKKQGQESYLLYGELKEEYHG